jgi:hypothetical protein
MQGEEVEELSFGDSEEPTPESDSEEMEQLGHAGANQDEMEAAAPMAPLQDAVEVAAAPMAVPQEHVGAAAAEPMAAPQEPVGAAAAAANMEQDIDTSWKNGLEVEAELRALTNGL